MGNWASGRSGGRPVKEDGLTIDLAWLLRSNWMMEGIRHSGLPLTWDGGTSADITYDYDLTDPEEARYLGPAPFHARRSCILGTRADHRTVAPTGTYLARRPACKAWVGTWRFELLSLSEP